MRKIRMIFIGCWVIVLSIIISIGAGHVNVLPVIIFIIVLMARFIRKSMENNSRDGNDSSAQTKESNTYGTHYTGTTITCDYCGSKVDTSMHAVCDHCGGPYFDDEEWIHNHNRKDV